MDDLGAAISKAELAVSVTPEDNPNSADRLNNLGIVLSARYNRTGNMGDLEAAISKAELAVSATPEDNLDRAIMFNNLGNWLSARYNRTGNIDDLEAAISKAELAVSATPEDHSNRAGALNNLGSKLADRYNRKGSIDDLEAAILNTELAVSAAPEGHPNRLEIMNNLGSWLSDRYHQTGNMDDLEAAILRSELVVSATPEDHPKRLRQLNNLGNQLSDRYNRTGDMDDLQAAISKAELVVSAISEDHPDRAISLSNLGSMLESRYNRTGNIEDLKAAISITELAISTTFDGHPDRAERLYNLGVMLSDQYHRTENMDDLEAAISKAELAVSATPEDHPNRAERLCNLGLCLIDLFDRTGNMDALQTALKYFEDCFDLSNAMPRVRLYSARAAIVVLTLMKNWDQASLLAQAALKLLPLVCGRYLSRADQQYAIMQISGLAADACSLSLQAGNFLQGLQQLEFGRGIILGYLIDGRDDLAQLQKDYPRLANDYDTLRFKAYTDIEAKEPVIREQLLRERREAAARLEDCLYQIRQANGFERFLMEPDLYELQECAHEGPIVIVNATNIRCDAIIIWPSQVKAIALPEMNSSQAPSFFQQKLGHYRRIARRKLKEYSRDVEDDMWGVANADLEQMSWLWSSCVKPILTELKDSKVSDDHELLRVWWIGTGIAGSLPFHAAGNYAKDVGNAQDSENTLAQIIPSYTPTIKALSYARSCALKAAALNSNETSILVVTMPTTHENKPLPGVNKEKLAIQQVTRHNCRIMALEAPTAKHVLENMSEFDIIHFACHGSADPKDPSNSHLLLQKSGSSGAVVDELTVSDISKKNTRARTWIAYLSACSTAGVEVKRLADECLHISSAFQVAGFAHVIGSLWSADDDICVWLAKSFYCSLTKNGTKHSNKAVAEALRNAILEIRTEFESPSLWGALIHSGA